MSDAESPDTPSDEQEPVNVSSEATAEVTIVVSNQNGEGTTPGTGTAPVSNQNGAENAPRGPSKKPRITVGRVILLGLLCVVVFMFIQDRRVSSSWTDAHEWLKEQELKAIESGTSFAIRDVRNYMQESYGLYPEDHPNLPKEYYRWSTWIREFTIEIQITTLATNDQVLQGHVRETSLFGMPGKNPDEQDVNATRPDGEAPPTTAPGGGGSEGPPGD